MTKPAHHTFWIRAFVVLPLWLVFSVPLHIFLILFDYKGFGIALRDTGEKILKHYKDT